MQRDPFTHESSVTGIELLALALRHELTDALLRQLGDELATRRHQSEQLAVDLEPAGAESLAVADGDPAVARERIDDLLEVRAGLESAPSYRPPP